MQRWRLSFHSSRPSRQLKKLWTDCNIKCDEDIEISKVKVLHIFLDALLTNDDPSTQRSNIDEIADDLLSIFNVLVYIVKYCQSKQVIVSSDPTTTAIIINHHPEDHLLWNELRLKCLLVTELLCTIKGSKTCLNDLIVKSNCTSNSSISNILQTLELSSNVVDLLSLVRILKAIIFHDQYLNEMVAIEGFRILAEVTLRVPEPSLIFQVVYLQRSFLEFSKASSPTKHHLVTNQPVHHQQQQSRETSLDLIVDMGSIELNERTSLCSSTSNTVSSKSNLLNPPPLPPSSSSSSSTSHHNQQSNNNNSSRDLFNNISNHNYQHHPSSILDCDQGSTTTTYNAHDDDNVSIAEQSLNLAYNLVNELLKYTPLPLVASSSGSSWFNGNTINHKNGRGGRDQSDICGGDITLVTDEQLLIASMMLPMSLIELETERLKLLSNPEKHSDMVVVVESVEQDLEKQQASTLFSDENNHISDHVDIQIDVNKLSEPVEDTNHAEYHQSSNKVDDCSPSKEEILQQNMLSIALLAIDKAVNPLEAIETLLTLQSILIADSNAQSIFVKADGYNKIFDMLVRIEDNLVLLVSCTDSSMAAATGDHPTVSRPSPVIGGDGGGVGGVNIDNNSSYSSLSYFNSNGLMLNLLQHCESLGAYYAFPKGDFDSYYSQVLMIIVNLIVDDVNLANSKIHPVSHLPFLLSLSSEIRNITAATTLLNHLIKSTYSGLNVIAIRICFALIRAHPPNALILETIGTINELMEKLLAIALTGTLDLNVLWMYTQTILYPDTPVIINTDEMHSNTIYDELNQPQNKYSQTSVSNRPTSYSITVLAAIFSDILSILQMVAVVTALRDQSIIAFMSVVLLNLSVHSNHLLSRNGSISDSTTNGTFDIDIRCHNCEMETSRLQCLNEGCVNDHCFMLCDECDKVFHKSTAKKSHIRIPTLLHNATTSNYCRTTHTDSSATAATNLSLNDRVQYSFTQVLNEHASITSILGALADQMKNGVSLKTLQKYNLFNTSFYTTSLLSNRGIRPNSNYNSMLADHKSSYDLLYRECLSCILLGNIKGLLDDGKVRLLDMPFEIFPALLRCIRSRVNCPLIYTQPDRKWNHKEQSVDYSFALVLSEKLNLSNLVDSNRTQETKSSSSSSSVFGQMSSNRSNDQLHTYATQQQQPPEVNHNSPRRIHFSLLIQCISRFLVITKTSSNHNSNLNQTSKHYRGGLFHAGSELGLTQNDVFHSDVNEVYAHHREEEDIDVVSNPSIQSKCMDLFMLLGIDAILMHICIDDSSSYVHSTAIDRQYILWLFRECILTASVIKSQYLHRYFHWFTWILRGNVSVGSMNTKIPIVPPVVMIPAAVQINTWDVLNTTMKSGSTPNHIVTDGKDKEKNVFICAQYPATVPTISLLIRLMILQELRLLIASYHTIESNTDKDLSNCSTLTASSISLIDTMQYESANSSRNFEKSDKLLNSTSNYFRTKQRQSNKYHKTTAQNNLLDNLSTKYLFYNMQMESKAMKHLMVELGYTELLLDLLLGSLCSMRVQYILNHTDNTCNGNSKTNSTNSTPSAFQLVDIEREEWWMVFSTLCQFIQGCDLAKDRLHVYIGEAQILAFLLPLLEYASQQSNQQHSSPQTNHCQLLFTTFMIELCVRKTNFAMHSNPFHAVTGKLPHQLVQAKQLIPRSAAPAGLGIDSSHQFTPGDCKYLDQLFARSTIATSTISSSSTINSSNESETFSASSNPASFSALSPIYYTQHKVLGLIADIFTPKPLTLFPVSFKQSFAIHTQSNNSLHSLKNKSLLKLANEASSRSQSFSEVPMTVNTDNNKKPLHSTSRNNYSTASVQSFDSENRWEIDSLAGSSTHGGDVTGRNSFHSYHSLIALSQALGGSQSATPTPSISGDNIFPHHGSKLNLIRGQSSDFHKPMNEKSNAGEENSSVNLFPATIGDKDCSSPTVFIPLLRHFFERRDEVVATNMLVLLHHILLIRGGYSNTLLGDATDTGLDINTPSKKDDDKDPSSSRQESIDVPELGFENDKIINEDVVELDCRNVLRKHLAAFILPSITTNQPQQWIKKELVHHPSYSRLEIFSPEAGELLLSAGLSTSASNQAFLFSVLSHLIDGNPSNSFKFIQKSSSCISLIRLLPHLTEHMQQVVGYILSQILRYSLQVPVFQEMIKSVSYIRNTVEESESKIYCKDLLFVMGRTAERKNPEIFFHFDLNSSFQSKIELPIINSIPVVPHISSMMNGTSTSVSTNDISICTWMRLGTFSDSPSCSFLQLYVDELLQLQGKPSNGPKILVNIYFRVVYKLIQQQQHSNHANNNNSAFTMSGNSKNKLENDHSQQAAFTSSKRVVQLCIGFGKSPIYSSSLDQNGDKVSNQSKPLQSTVTKESIPEPQSVINNNALHSNNLILETTDAITTADARLMHWNIAVEQFLGESSFGDDSLKDSQESAVNSSSNNLSMTSLLANTLGHYSLPDAIIEFDWSEMGDWHLLCLSFTSDGILCSVDGSSKPVLYWTPLGYIQHAIGKNLKEKIPTAGNSLDMINSASSKDSNIQYFLDTLPRVSKEHPLKVVLGGLQYEYAAYQYMKDKKFDAFNLTKSFDAMISGFAGMVGETAIVSGVPHIHQLMNCLRLGPNQGLQELKSTRLSELTNATLIGILPQSSSTSLDAVPLYSSGLENTPALIPSSSSSPISSDSKKELPLIYSSHVKDKNELIRQKNNIKLKDLKTFKFYDSVQIHRTNTMIATLKSMGGLKILYPMFIVDRARLVAALRVIGCIIMSSSDSLRDFQAMDTDKVILYCTIKYPDLITLETLQVLFDIVCDSTGSLQSLNSLQNTTINATMEGGNFSNIDIIYRTVVLELLFNIVIASSKDCQLARSLIDWLREICDDEINNCQKVLKHSGLFPFLVILSIWDIGTFDNTSYKPILIPRINTTSIISATATIGVNAISNSKELSSTTETSKDLSKEFKTIDLNKINNFDLTESAAELALLANKYKLQFSCYRYIKLLISGTSGEVSNIPVNANLQITTTEFNAMQLSILLSFAVTACNSKNETISTDAAGMKSVKERNKEKTRKNNRLKRLIYGSGTCGGIPVLRDIDITASNYWLLSGSLVVLDAILDLSKGALQGHLITMMKTSFQSNVFNAMILQLMNSESIEIRIRSIYILILSFSTPTGKLDPKQVYAFDKMHGFQSMAEQLTNFTDGCTTEILDAICSLLFWKQHSSSGSKVGSKIDSGVSSDSIHSQYPLNVEETQNNSPQTTTTIAEESTTATVNINEECVSDIPIKLSSNQSNRSVVNSPERNNTNKVSDENKESAHASGSILSIFWGSSSVAGTTKPSTTEEQLKLGTIQVASSSDIESQNQNIDTISIDIHSIDHIDSKNILPNPDVIVPVAIIPETNIENIHVVKNNSASNIHQTEPIVSVENIEIPQALEVLFKILQNSKSSEQINTIFKRLDNSIAMNHTLPLDQYPMNKINNIQRSVNDIQFHNALQQQFLNNMEQIFLQKDWLLWLCDLLMIFKRNTINSFLDDHGSIFSLSENDSISHMILASGQSSIGGAGVGDSDHMMYEDYSEDSNSISGETMSEELNTSIYSKADSQSGGISSQQQQLIDQYTSSIYNFICKLIVQDMTSSKLNSNRRWNELFRISLPELNDIQEAIMLDIVRNVSNLIEHSYIDQGIIINIFKNFGMLLEQALEKADLSLLFSVKVIQALHSINYNCTPEIRIRIQETYLPEVRKGYVTKCLLDSSSDYYSKVAALSETNSSIQNYISLREFKLLTDVQTVMIILGLLVEACEDMEFLLGGIDSTPHVFNPSYINPGDHTVTGNLLPPSIGSAKDRLGSPITVSTGIQDRLQLLLEVMEALIICIQNCVISSIECNKCVSKLVLNIPCDPFSFVADALIHSFNKSTSGENTSQSVSQKINTSSNQSIESIPNTPSINVTASDSTNKLLVSTSLSNDPSTNGDTIATLLSSQAIASSDIENGIKPNVVPTLNNTSSSATTGSSSTYNWWSWSTVASASATDQTPISPPNTMTMTTGMIDAMIAAGNKTELSSGSNHLNQAMELSNAEDLVKSKAAPTGEFVDHASVDVQLNTNELMLRSVLDQENNDSDGNSNNERPKNIRSFLRWFCSFEQREVQSIFRLRVLTEIKTTQRHVDKLKEKSFQRYMRFTRTAQEKRTKEKISNSKLIKDAVTNNKLLSDKVMVKFQKDLKQWIVGIHEKADTGRNVFNNSSVQVTQNTTNTNTNNAKTDSNNNMNSSNDNIYTKEDSLNYSTDEIMKYLEIQLNQSIMNPNTIQQVKNNHPTMNMNPLLSTIQQSSVLPITSSSVTTGDISSKNDNVRMFQLLSKFFRKNNSNT